MADKPSTPRRGARNSRTTFTSASRVLLLWYTIVTIFLRCPSTPGEVTDDSPWMCAPYFETRDKVAPYVTPYYNAYAAPYVDAHVTPYLDSYIQPYLQQARPYANLVQSKVYDPAAHAVKKTYNKYGASRIAQVKDYVDSEWDKTVKPHIDTLLLHLHAQYQKYLEPHVLTADLAIRPYLVHAQTSAIDVYHRRIVPTYQKLSPRFLIAYARVRALALHVIYPRTQWALQTTGTFISRRIWPTIRILYGQHIEPPLSKIRERLSSYRDSKRLEAAVDALDEDIQAASTDSEELYTSISSIPSESSSETVHTTSTTNLPVTTTSEIPSTSHSSTMVASETLPATTGIEKVTDDLNRWQAKFKAAADRGAEDLASRVSDIIKRQVSSQVEGVGPALVIQLEEAAKDAVAGVKVAITDAVKRITPDTSNEDKGSMVEELHGTIRAAGKDVKARAQSLRSWKLRFNEELRALITAASRSTLNVIDGIRDLGLQDIGMRWASMDNVTYQDWAEYHNLKETFDEWRDAVEKSATEHEELLKATQAAEDLEAQGMAIAEDAAKELARLKDVAVSKVETGDASDSFETRGLRDAAAKFGQKILDKIALGGSATQSDSNTVESLTSQVLAHASSAQSVATEAISDTIHSLQEETPSDDDLTETVASTVESITDAASESAETIASAVAETTSSATDSASSLTEDASEGVVASFTSLTADGSATISPIVDSVTKSAATAASEALVDVSESLTDQNPISSIPSLASDGSSVLDSDLTHATTKIPDALHSLSSALEDNYQAASASVEDDVIPAMSSLSSSLSDTLSESIPTAASSLTSNIGEGLYAVSSSLLSSASSLTSTVAATLAPSIGSAISMQSGDFVDRAQAMSESIKSKVQSAGSDDEVRSLTSRLMDEL